MTRYRTQNFQNITFTSSRMHSKITRYIKTHILNLKEKVVKLQMIQMLEIESNLKTVIIAMLREVNTFTINEKVEVL